jgi:hypothetical protein
MSQTIQSNPQAMVESIARVLPPSAKDDFRTLMNEVFLANLTALSPGGNLIQPGGPSAGSSTGPAGVTHTVTGANGVATIAITNPPNNKQTIYHEISYSPVISFTKNVTTQPPTTATSITIPQSGVLAYYRLRSSFDKKTWTDYQMAQTSPVDAGLVESSAMAAGAAFNQTNYAQVNSQTSGPAQTITINGPGGIFSPYTAVRGATQARRPSATIIGTQLGPTQFVGWDGKQFKPLSTLAGVLADNLEPVGAVVVGSGTSGGGGVRGNNGGRLTQDLPVV